jgi:hypothetical protein
MNISRKLMALGLALVALGDTCVFARPALHSENVCLSHKANMAEARVPTTRTPGAAGYAGRSPSINAIQDDWPANLHQE